ncbi:alpha/beta-hydrolase [Ramaria rubella]|nr:alpha/beta-hydrolase [Ramaria rubella]
MAQQTSRLYKELAAVPNYTSAYFLKSGTGYSSTIRVTTSVRDHLRNVKRTAVKHIVSTASDVIATPSQEASELASVPSPSGTRIGILREVSDGALKKRFVEVWLGDHLEAIKEVTKLHGEFYLTPMFFSLSFSKSESSFIYTAEVKAPEVDENSTSEATAEKFRFVPDLGEQLTGKTKPNLYIFRWTRRDQEGESSKLHTDVEDPTVFALKPSGPDNSTLVFGQAAFSPDERYVFTTGIEETLEGRRLGAMYCLNHPSAIFKLELPKEFPRDSGDVTVNAQRLTPPEISARSARVTDAAPGEPYTIVWLSNSIGGPHASATTLNSLRSDEEKSRILVGSISEPSSPGAFPGLYVGDLHSRPFLSLDSDSEVVSHLFTTSILGSRQTILAIALSSGEVCELTPGGDSTWSFFGTDGRNSLLALRSMVNSPHELLETRMEGFSPVPEWKVIDKPTLSAWARSKLDTIKSSVIPIPALEGYVISLVNYTGSLGFGQKYVEALIGRAGDLDIKDCYYAAKHLVKLGLAQEGPGKQFLQGGSHGGFIIGNLIGQYPEFFSAAIMWNPVTAAAELASITDIPDYKFTQYGEEFGPRSIITPDIFKKLQKASPIAHIDAVQTPVLLLVGGSDRRVLPSQSKNYYYALKGRGRDVNMLVFPGSTHLLDGVEVQAVAWEATRNFLVKFTKSG